MNEKKHSHQRHGGPGRDSSHDGQRPYWKRAHCDWRFWVGLVFMFAAISIYVMSEDLVWMPRSQPRQAPSENSGDHSKP
jgi:hypothetical protein